MLRSRTVLEMLWPGNHVWTAWAIALPTGILVYCDDDGDEARVLASVKRGNQAEADGFFLDLLAETRGQAFGMEMSGSAPERVRTIDRRSRFPGGRVRRAVRGHRSGELHPGGCGIERT